MNGYLLGGSIGKKTYTYKNSNRVSKPELAAAVKKHFMGSNVKESETIVDFIYSVRKQGMLLRLSFLYYY
jgi:histone deacetylase complex subunit SAP30